MSVLQKIENALSGVDFAIGKGQYPDTQDDCGKVVFSGYEQPTHFLGGKSIDIETFDVIVSGLSYKNLEKMSVDVKDALKKVGFIQIGGLKDIESADGETYLQIGQHFKIIKN